MSTTTATNEGLFTVRTDVFEGPLDLLLYLVRRDGVDIRHLPIASIADAYLGFLERMRALDLALAADWLVMAATLVYLKSLELLPRPPALLEEEEQDPREKLRIQLEEYERVKASAEALDGQTRVGRDVFVREGMTFDKESRPLASPIDAFGLLELYFELLQRKERPPPVVELVSSGPDVGNCCKRVLDELGGVGGTVELGQLLASLEEPAERVVTFVGVLEMARLRWMDVEQDAHLGPVTVTQVRERGDMDLELVSGDSPEPLDDEDPQGVLPLGGGADA